MSKGPYSGQKRKVVEIGAGAVGSTFYYALAQSHLKSYLSFYSK